MQKCVLTTFIFGVNALYFAPVLAQPDLGAEYAGTRGEPVSLTLRQTRIRSYLFEVENRLSTMFHDKNLRLPRLTSLSFHLDESGRVTDLKMEKSSGNKKSDKAFEEILRSPTIFKDPPAELIARNPLSAITQVSPSLNIRPRDPEQRRSLFQIK